MPGEYLFPGYGVVSCGAVVATIAAATAVAQTSSPPVPRTPGLPYAARSLPDRIVLNPGSDPAHEMAVSFRTDASQGAAIAEIAVAPEGPTIERDARRVGGISEPIATSNGAAVYHHVRFAGLRPDTTYAYRVKGSAGWSEWLQFQTPVDAFRPFRFLYFADVQNGILPQASRVIRQAFRSAGPVALAIHTGDQASQRDDLDPPMAGRVSAARNSPMGEAAASPRVSRAPAMICTILRGAISGVSGQSGRPNVPDRRGHMKANARVFAMGISAFTGFSGPAVAQIAAIEPTATRAALTENRPLPNGVDIRRDGTLLRIVALTDSIIRVRIGREGTLPEDASWAVLPAPRHREVKVSPTPTGFATDSVQVNVDAQTLGITITDNAGKVISADAPVALVREGRGFTLQKKLPLTEHIYGLGDKTGGSLDRRGQSFVDWNTDAFGFSSTTDPLYKSIPFFIGSGGAGGSYGVLFDNSWRAWFDFGHRNPDTLAFGAPDGPIDYYLIAGPSIAEVVRRYTDLTGRAPLPPRWAFGYQQSRYSYMSADEVRDIAGRLRSDKIPTDVIWLDIDFQDRNRPFTINKTAFPDMQGLAADLNRSHIKLVAITDLHVGAAPGQGYAPYDTGAAGKHFVRAADGSVFVGKVWPGDSVFPDFTDASARAWWGTLFKPFMDLGLAGFWNCAGRHAAQPRARNRLRGHHPRLGGLARNA